MKKLPTITIGIPAYNEGSNIALLLSDVLKQRQLGWRLKEILVVSEGSTDRTAERARSVHSSLVKIITENSRRGKSYALNIIFRSAKSDIVILFDADVRLSNINVVGKLVACFEKDKRIMLVAGNRMPFPPKNFVQRGIYATFKVFYASRMRIRNGRNIFACQGGCLALKSTFVKSLKLPEIICDDAYLYLVCVTNGGRFEYVDDAVVNHKTSNTLSDYLKQLFRSRPESVNLFLKKYFGIRVRQEFHRPRTFYLSAIFNALVEDPFPTAFIILVNFIATPFIPFFAKRYTTSWPVATSTK